MSHVKRVGALFTAFCALAASAFGGAGVALAANSNSSVVPDQVQRGGVAVVKYDAETKDCTKPQGGADLAGAEFTITNNSEHPIVFADENGKKTTYMVGESWTIQTKKVTDQSSPFFGKYVAMTSAKALPYGTYHIQETKGSPGYGLATKNNYLNHKYVPGYVTAKMREWVDTGYDFQITADGQFVTFDGENTATKTSDAEGKSYSAGPAAYNPLIRGGIEVVKRDHDLLRATAQGNAGLEGGTFVIYNYNDYAVQVWDHFDQQSTAPDSPAGNHGPAQSTYHGVTAENYTVTLRSGETISTEIGEDGWVEPGGIVAIIQTGDDGRAQTFMDALPVGWYTIVEREAPIGYVREERWQSYVQVTDDDWDSLVVTDCDDPVLRGAAQVQKFDATLLADGTYGFAAGEAQGDGSLAGAHIEIYNNSNKDVWIREADFTDAARGVSYNTGDVSGISGRVAPGGKVAEIVTNEQGIATIKGLPFGSYYAVEKEASNGYALNSDWRWDFEIKDSTLGSCDTDGQNVVAKADGPERGAKPGDEKGLSQDKKTTKDPVDIYKVDAETGEEISLVDGKPFDMSFELINASKGAVEFNGVRYEPGESLGVFDTIVSGEDELEYGHIKFDGQVDEQGHYAFLPVGKYQVREVRAPEGYVKDTRISIIEVKDTDLGLVADPFKFSDQVIREDIQFQKVDADTSKPMSGIPFLLEKLDKDGNVMERHILVTDEDGMVDTSGDISGYQGWRARMKDGEPHYNLADKYYDEATGEFTYVAPYADKEAVLAELNGDGTEEHPGLIKELEDLMAQLDELLTKANVEGIKSLYDELVQIVRDANAIAVEKGDQSPEYAAKIKEQADKIIEIHEAIAAAKAAAGDDYAEQIDLLEASIKAKEAEIADAQERLAAIDDELSGDAAIWETGYWFFGGEQGDGIEPNETDGALPYGDYRLTELRCDANKGYDLMSREIHIKRGHGMVENYGTIDNKPYDDCDPCADETVHGLDVDMHKDSNPAPNSVVKSGSDITYTLSYENTSAEKVPYLLVRDEIPESTTFKSAANDGVYVKDKNAVEWVVTDVEPGATGTVSFTVTVDKGARSVISNQARFGTYKTEIVAGENDENPIGSTNVVRHSTDGTKTGGYLSAVKRAEPAAGSTVKIGDEIKYYVDVTNKGDTDMEAVAVVDTIPVGTTLASGVDDNYYDVDMISDGGYRIGNEMVGWNLGTLKAGETKTVSFTVTVNDDVRYSVSNQATFGTSRAKCTGLLSNTTNIVTHKVETLPELTITKSCDRERTTTHGEILTYTLHVENNGRGNAVNVPVYDIIPEGTQYVMGSISTDVKADESHTYPFTSVEGEGAADATELVEAKPYVNWTIPVLYNRGGSMDLTYQVRVRDDVAVGDIIQNRATVGGEGPQAVDVEEPTVTTDVTKPAVSNLVEHEVIDAADDVEVIKTADPVDGSSVAAGDEITYTVTATNNGEHSVHGFGIRDAIPEHTTFVDGSIVVIGPDGKSSTEIAEEAQQQTQEGDECGTVPDDVSIVWTPEAMLNVGNMNEADAEGIYKIVVPDEAHYKIYSWGTIKRALTHLGVGESIEFEVQSDDGYNLYWRATYMEDGRLLLWKRVLVPNATDSVNYTRANGVYANYDQKWRDVYAITDELKPGETITLTFTVKVDDDVEDNTEIKNVATYGHGVYSAPCFDLDHTSNETTHVVGTPHIVAEKKVDKADARRGDVLTYTVTLTNDGTARAKNVAIHDEFRSAEALSGLTYVVGSWNVSGADGAQASEAMAGEFDAATRFVAARCNTLEPGDSLTMTFQCLVADAADGDVIKNKATWEINHEGNPIYGDLSEETNEVQTVIGEPKLSLEKTVDPVDGSTVEVGDTITYNFKITNDSAVYTDNAAVFDMIPSYTTLVDGSLTGGLEVVRGEDVPVMGEDGQPMLDDDGNAVTEPGPVIGVAAGGIHLESGESHEFSFKVSVDPSLTENVTISNTATGGFSNGTPTMPLQTSSNTTVNNAVAPDTELRIVKSATPDGGTELNVGDVITYTFTVMNESTTPAKDVCVFDYIPDHTTFVDGSATGGLKYVASGLVGDKPAVIASGLTLGANEKREMSFQVKVSDTLEDLIVSNRATIGEFRGTPTAPLDIDSNEVISNVSAPKPAISITDASDPASGTQVKAGDVITYTFKVTETEGIPANGVAVFDYVPANTTFIDGSETGGLKTIKNSAGNVIAVYADGISLDGKGSAEFSYQVEVNGVSADTEIANQPTAGFAEAPQLPLAQVGATLTHNIVAEKPVLRLTKTATPGPGSAISAGDVIDYSFTVSNDSDAIARGVAVFDRVPANTTYVEGSADGLTELKDENGNVYALYADNITLAGHRSRSFGFAVTVNDGEDIIVSNRATAGFAKAPTTDLELDSNEVMHGAAAPDLRVTKAATPGAGTALEPGDVITYDITVKNASTGADRNVQVYDKIPAGTTYVDGSLAADGATEATFANGAIAVRYDKLAGKATHHIIFKVTVDDKFAGNISNVASFGHGDGLPEGDLPEQTNGTTNVSSEKQPQLRITKSANPGAGVALSVNDEITYTITVSNDGEGDAHGVAVFDRVPDHTTYVDGSASGLELTDDGSALYADGLDIASGESKTFTFKVRVAEQGVIISNRATTGFAEKPTTDLELDSNEVVNAAEAPNTEIALSSDPVNGATVTDGSDITYTITVKNSGRGADHDVAVYAPIPDGTAYIDGSLVANDAESIAQTTDGTVTGIAAHYDVLAPNSTHTITFKVRVMDTAGATVDEKATMGHVAELPTSMLETESNQVRHILDRAPVLSIVKSQNPGSGAWVAGGDELTYSIKVTNEGNTVARKVGVYDEAPENTTYVAGSLATDRGEVYEGSDGLLTNIAGDLMPGESVTMTFKVRIDLGFVGTIYNRAMWVSPAADPEAVADNDQQADATPASDPAEGQGAAAPTATVVPSTRVIGVLGATVPIPEGSYSGISNEVTAGGAGNDTPSTPSTPSTPDTPDTPDTPSTPETPAGDSGSNEVNAGVKAPEVKITKTATPSGTVKAGSTITYTIRMENTGDVNANMLYMRDNMPEGITFKAGTVTVDGMTYEVKDGNVIGRCSLKPGEVATITFKATVGSTFSGDIVNVAEWGQAEDGKAPKEMLGSSKVTNVAATEELGGDSNEVNAYVNKPTIQLVKTSDPEDGSIVKPGTEVTYTLTASNIGRVNANGLYIEDVIPAGLTVDADSVKGEGGLEATFADGKIVARGSLHPTESGTVTFKATIAKDFSGDIVNVASWGQADPDKTPEKFDGNSNEDLLHVGTTEVELIKSCDHADGTFVSRGAKLTYTVTAENKGTLDVDLVVTDKIPEGITFEDVEIVDGVGEASVKDGVVTFTAGVVKPGDKVSFKFSGTVDSDAVGDIKNVATWSDPDGDTGESNSVINHVSDPKISVTKTNNAEGGKVKPGDVVSYSIHVTNSGTTAGIVRVTDTIPEGLTLDRESVRVTTDSILDAVNADEEQSSGEEISVEVTDNTPFGALSRAFTSFIDWITGKASEEAGIIVDEGSIKGAFSVEPNQTVAITYNVTVKDDVELGKAITNVVDAEVEGGDPSHSESVVTPGEALITMHKTTDIASDTSVKVGDTITYYLSMSNDGTAESDIITMTDTIPTHTTYVAGSAKIVDADGNDKGIAEDKIVTKDKNGKVNGVAYEIGRVAPKSVSDVTLTFQVKVNKAGDVSSVENVAHWTAVDDPDDTTPTKPEPSNPVVTPVDPGKDPKDGPKLEIKKVGVDSNGKETSTFKSNSAQDWKITVTNTGDEVAKNVSVKDLFGDGLTFVKATEGSRTLSAEVTGRASTTSAYASKLATSARSFQNSDGSYSLGVSSFKDGYLYGSATEGVSTNNYATAIPMGTYEVTIADGYRGVVQVIAMDDDGKVVTNGGFQGTLGYSTSANKLTVTIPDNGRLVITCQKNTNNAWNDANTSDHAFTFTPKGATHMPETSSSEDYAATFSIDAIEAGKSVTITVTTKTSADAPSKVTNKATAYLGASDKDGVSSQATLTRSDYSEPAKKPGTENLPQTAAAVAGVIAVGAGIAALGYGIYRFRRKDEDTGANPEA